MIYREPPSARHTPQPKDDLEMLVHTIYATFVDPAKYGRLAQQQPQQPHNQREDVDNWITSLINYWTTSLDIDGWREALVAARNLDYEALIVCMEKFVPL